MAESHWTVCGGCCSLLLSAVSCLQCVLGVAHTTNCPLPLPAHHLASLCRFTEGIYVLYTYTATPNAGQAVQKYLSTPTAGAELNILR